MTRPTAAPAHFPYNHRTMAEVMADERKEAFRRAAERHNEKLWREMVG